MPRLPAAFDANQPRRMPPPLAQGSLPTFETNKPKKIAPRILLHAVEGWGKTTLGAYAPNPAFIMSQDETGFEDLLSAGRVPNIQRLQVGSWGQVLGVLSELARSCPFETLNLDSMGGFERMVHEHTCRTDFNGEWGEKGFMAFHKGYKMSVTPWMEMLALLDEIQAQGVTVVMLSHSQTQSVQNPLGADYDRFGADLQKDLSNVTLRWASEIVFGTFETVVVTSKSRRGDPELLSKGKGIGGTERVIRTSHTDAWQAKSRNGMPPVVRMPDQPEMMWKTFWDALTGKEFE